MRLLYANVSPDDILLRDELDALAAAHPDRFSVWYTGAPSCREEGAGDAGVGAQERARRQAVRLATARRAGRSPRLTCPPLPSPSPSPSLRAVDKAEEGWAFSTGFIDEAMVRDQLFPGEQYSSLTHSLAHSRGRRAGRRGVRRGTTACWQGRVAAAARAWPASQPRARSAARPAPTHGLTHWPARLPACCSGRRHHLLPLRPGELHVPDLRGHTCQQHELSSPAACAPACRTCRLRGLHAAATGSWLHPTHRLVPLCTPPPTVLMMQPPMIKFACLPVSAHAAAGLPPGRLAGGGGAPVGLPLGLPMPVRCPRHISIAHHHPSTSHLLKTAEPREAWLQA